MAPPMITGCVEGIHRRFPEVQTRQPEGNPSILIGVIGPTSRKNVLRFSEENFKILISSADLRSENDERSPASFRRT